MTSRQNPPNRRLCETSKIKIPINFDDPGFGRQSIYVSVGTSPGCASIIEVFYAGGFKSGSSLKFIVMDACNVLSMELQNGIEVRELHNSLSRRELPDETLVSASLLCVIADQLVVRINDA